MFVRPQTQVFIADGSVLAPSAYKVTHRSLVKLDIEFLAGFVPGIFVCSSAYGADAGLHYEQPIDGDTVAIVRHGFTDNGFQIKFQFVGLDGIVVEPISGLLFGDRLEATFAAPFTGTAIIDSIESNTGNSGIRVKETSVAVTQFDHLLGSLAQIQLVDSVGNWIPFDDATVTSVRLIGDSCKATFTTAVDRVISVWSADRFAHAQELKPCL